MSIFDEYDLELALGVISRVENLQGMTLDFDYNVEGYPEMLATGNHFFSWGYVHYGRWEIESSAAWCAELRPVRDENGALVDYEIVGIEQVD